MILESSAWEQVLLWSPVIIMGVLTIVCFIFPDEDSEHTYEKRDWSNDDRD